MPQVNEISWMFLFINMNLFLLFITIMSNYFSLINSFLSSNLFLSTKKMHLMI